MGALTFTLDQEQPTTAGPQRRVTGYMTFSNSYGPGVETFDPADLGLQILDRMLVDAAIAGSTPNALIAINDNLAAVQSTRLAGGASGGAVALFEGAVGPLTVVADTTDVSDYTAHFVAYGV